MKRSSSRFKALAVSAGIIIISLLFITWKQVGYWKNSITIFKHAIRVTEKKYPEFSLVFNNLGIALFAKQDNKEAISHYKMAIKFNPDHFWAHNNLGRTLAQKGEMQEAVDHFRETVRLRPDLDAARDNLEFALFRLQQLK